MIPPVCFKGGSRITRLLTRFPLHGNSAILLLQVERFRCINNVKKEIEKMTEAFNDETIGILQRSVLFQGVSPHEMHEVLSCLGARCVAFEKDERIFRVGDGVDTLGVVLSGSVLVGSEDYWGNGNIIARIGPGGLFAEAFACLPDEASTVNVVAASACRIAFLDVRRITDTCVSSCAYHQRIIRNLLMVLACKNLTLTRKVEHVTKRTTREKVLAYLSSCSQQAGSSRFDIPFNRQQLADYLAVERSALSSCLGKMQREGLISFKKNRFELK